MSSSVPLTRVLSGTSDSFDRWYARCAVTTTIIRMADILRKLDDTCKAAYGLRTVIERQMGSAAASVKPAKDDTAVLDARKAADKTTP